MARALPNKIGKVPKEVAKAFRQLKKLPDDYTIWYSLPQQQDGSKAPHFLVIWKNQFAYLVHVAATDQKLAETALHANLFDTEETLSADELGSHALNVLGAFSAELQKTLPVPIPVRHLVLFPNVAQGTLDTITLQRSSNAHAQFLGKEQLSETSLPSFLESMAQVSLDKREIVHLRHHFTPETSVPESFSALSVRERNTSATLSSNLLDIDQEWCTKHNLYLPEEAQEIANSDSAKSLLVTGVAGSGKSLVLLYRTLLNARLNPGARILVLTHNRPINNELNRRFHSLTKEQHHTVEWRTFFSWATSLIGMQKNSPVSSEKTITLLDDLRSKFPENKLTSAFLCEEIGYLKDNNVRKLSDYLELKRVGRGTKLSINQRKQVWLAFKVYQEYLRDNNLTDWHGVAIKFYDKAMGGALPLPAYDCIFIDEAQFFAKTWFDVVKKALKPNGQLFLSADPTQGFLKRRQSWISSGIDVRGRTHRLHKAYRNSREILKFATAFFDSRQQELTQDLAEEGLNIPSAEQISEIQIEGTKPQVIYCPTLLDCHQRAAQEIAALQKSELENSQTLILHADSKQLYALETTLRAALGSHFSVHNAKDGVMPNSAFCQTSTLNAATGLEASIVFLLGIDHLLDAEEDPRLTTEERAELIAAQTRQLYMAFTRAGQRLVILTKNKYNAEALMNLRTQ